MNELIAPVSFSGFDQTTKVYLVGAGGTGSAVLGQLFKLHKSLIATGGKGLSVTVFDPKKVTLTNVIRQGFWSESDVGYPKATLAVNRFNQFGGMNWSAINEEYSPSRDLPDLLITTIDSAKGRLKIGRCLEALKEHAVSKDRLWLDIGNGSKSGNALIGSLTGYNSKTKTPSPYQLLAQQWEEVDDSEISKPSCSAIEALAKQPLGINDAVSSLAQFMLLYPLFKNGKCQHQGFYFDQENFGYPIRHDSDTWAMYGFVPETNHNDCIVVN
mgnify:CR=1 FL=1